MIGKAGHILITVMASKQLPADEKKWLVGLEGYRGIGTDVESDKFAYLNYMCHNLNTVQAVIERLEPGTFFIRVDKVWDKSIEKEHDPTF